MFSTCHSNLAVTSCSAVKRRVLFIFRTVWWFESWYDWRISYLILQQFRLALVVEERRCQAAAEGCNEGCPAGEHRSPGSCCYPPGWPVPGSALLWAGSGAGRSCQLSAWCLGCPWQLYRVPVHVRSSATAPLGEIKDGLLPVPVWAGEEQIPAPHHLFPCWNMSCRT